jgi:hypothetical protein
MNVWMTSLVVCLILPFDPHTASPRNHRSHLCPLLSQTMNHPYLYPDQAEWTEEFQELHSLRSQHRDDEGEDVTDLLFWHV